ncbi:MAG: hypothetical protein ACREP7_02175, partial [Lysobacter sp.]
LEEHIIAEGAGALALAAGRRIAAKRKCAVVSGGNLDAGVLARLLSEVRPRAPRRPRRRIRDSGVREGALHETVTVEADIYRLAQLSFEPSAEPAVALPSSRSAHPSQHQAVTEELPA